MESALGTLVLKLRPVCEGCTPGAPSADPARQAQVDGEYAELKESLTDYAALAKRVKERAAFLEVAIAPKTEPGMEDVAEAMGLYAAMNERVAPMCGETARACVRQYSKYEACKKDDLHAECGVPPSCEATCALTETGFRSLNATVCRDTQRQGVDADSGLVGCRREAEGAAEGVPGEDGGGNDCGSCNSDYRAA